MSQTYEIEHGARKISITVSKTSKGTFIGTFEVPDTDPPVTGTGPDSDSEQGALKSAERAAKERLGG